MECYDEQFISTTRFAEQMIVNEKSNDRKSLRPFGLEASQSVRVQGFHEKLQFSLCSVQPIFPIHVTIRSREDDLPLALSLTITF